MRICVPTLGSHLRLTSPWTFTLYRVTGDTRNLAFAKTLGLPAAKWDVIQLPAGTVLQVERIYIRQHQEKYDSMSFRVVGQKKSRFWVKLEDANKIECEVVA